MEPFYYGNEIKMKMKKISLNNVEINESTTTWFNGMRWVRKDHKGKTKT